MKKMAQIFAATAAIIASNGLLMGQANAFTISSGTANPTSFHDIINEFQQFANTERQALDPATVGMRVLDPTKLFLNYDYDVKTYFVNEGAGYRNQLGVTATGATQLNEILFNDISCRSADCIMPSYNQQFGLLSDNNALKIGDYADLGNVSAGTQLNFWLRRDGFGRQTTDVFYADASQNPDNLQHMMAYDYKGYLVLTWEDILGGGDRDYNDAVFALDIGGANLSNLPSAAVPEPPAIAGISIAAVGLVLLRFRGQEIT